MKTTNHAINTDYDNFIQEFMDFIQFHEDEINQFRTKLLQQSLQKNKQGEPEWIESMRQSCHQIINDYIDLDASDLSKHDQMILRTKLFQFMYSSIVFPFGAHYQQTHDCLPSQANEAHKTIAIHH